MNDETGPQNRTVNAIATSKVRISLCLFIQNPPAFIRTKIFVDVIMDMYMFLVNFY